MKQLTVLNWKLGLRNEELKNGLIVDCQDNPTIHDAVNHENMLQYCVLHSLPSCAHYHTEVSWHISCFPFFVVCVHACIRTPVWTWAVDAHCFMDQPLLDSLAPHSDHFGSIQLLLQVVQWALFKGLKLLWHEVYHCPPFASKAKIAWIFTSTSLFFHSMKLSVSIRTQL